jgi:hypothetical protein
MPVEVNDGQQLIRGLTIVLLLISAGVWCQEDSIVVKETMSRLETALVKKDHAVIGELLEKDCSYGHSNGWVQKRNEVLEDSKSGKLVYEKIENSQVWIASIGRKKAVTRANTYVEGVVNGNVFKMKLHVMQVWIKNKRGWKLMARQSAKL